MKNKSLLIISGLIVSLVIAGTAWTTKVISDLDDRYVLDELIKNGEKPPLHYISEVDEEQVRIGKDLTLKGWTIKDGKKSKRISRYFVCTDCHNIENEEEDLLSPSPEGRLRYAKEHDLPFLQATTFYGMVDRRTWYNGDYVKKYGDWIKPARDTLSEAVQLCAKVCSQGRYLEEWEMTAFMHYFHTLGYKMKDLNFSTLEKKQLISDTLKKKNIELIESKYLGYSPATFGEVTPKSERKYGENGNPENGKLIYDLSCKHCHKHENPATSLKIDDSKLTFKLFNSRVKQYSRFSLYNIVRNGTYAEAGMRAYMPHYTMDRMSDQQLEDLVAYVKSKAK